MKKIEWKLISELMKNSRRSDRELAKVIGTSQPTVSRIRERLERQGFIKEYTMIPDFKKLGFELMAVTFVKFKQELNDEELKNIRKAAKETEQSMAHSAIVVMSGRGLGYDRVVVSFHENYNSFMSFLEMTRRLPYLDLIQVDSFLISLVGEDHYMPPTFLGLANYIMELRTQSG